MTVHAGLFQGTASDLGPFDKCVVISVIALHKNLRKGESFLSRDTRDLMALGRLNKHPLLVTGFSANDCY